MCKVYPFIHLNIYDDTGGVIQNFHIKRPKYLISFLSANTVASSLICISDFDKRTEQQNGLMVTALMH